MDENLTLALESVIGALAGAFATDIPDTKAGARKLAGSLTAPVSALTDWVSELNELIDQLETASTDLADGEPEDRADLHAAWIEAGDQLADHLRAGVRAPA